MWGVCVCGLYKCFFFPFFSFGGVVLDGDEQMDQLIPPRQCDTVCMKWLFVCLCVMDGRMKRRDLTRMRERE